MTLVNLEAGEVAEAGKCQTISEAFRTEARRLVGRVCRQYLDEKVLTATELVSSVEHQVRFSESGQEMQRAVQLISGAQSRVFNMDLHKRMRGIYTLCDKVRERVQEILDEGVPEVQPGHLVQVMSELSGKGASDRLDIAVCIAIAIYLKPATTWESKLSHILGLIEAEETERVIIYLDAFIADILDSNTALKGLLGESETLANRLRELASLYKGKWEPPRDRETVPLLRRLNSIMAAHQMPVARLAIKDQVQRALQSGAPIAPGGGIFPLLELCRVYEELQFEGETIGGDIVTDAIQSRMNRQAEPENIIMLLEDKTNVHERIKTLLELQQRLIGDQNKRQIATLIKNEFERREFPKDLLSLGESPSQKLKVVSQLYDIISEAELPSGLQERFLEFLEEVQMNFIKENKIFAKINKQSRNVAETVLKLADLCRSGLFTRGQNLLYVHSLIKHQVNQSAFMKVYLAGVESEADKKARIADLKRRLAEAGIQDLGGGKKKGSDEVDAA